MLSLGAGSFHRRHRGSASLLLACSSLARGVGEPGSFDNGLSLRQTSTLLDRILSHCKLRWSWTKPAPPSLRPIESTSMEVGSLMQSA